MSVDGPASGYDPNRVEGQMRLVLVIAFPIIPVSEWSRMIWTSLTFLVPSMHCFTSRVWPQPERTLVRDANLARVNGCQQRSRYTFAPIQQPSTGQQLFIEPESQVTRRSKMARSSHASEDG